MNTIEVITKRRTTRAFDPSFSLPVDTINELISLGSKAPSSFNIQHTRFVVVRDPELRQKIRRVAMDQSQVTDAALLVIVCANVAAWKEPIDIKWAHVSCEIQTFIKQRIVGFYNENKATQRDEAIRSCGMATQNLLLAATSMGLESGALVGFDFEKVGTLINLPENHLISNFIVIGKGIEEGGESASRLSLSEILIENSFNL